MLGRRPMASLLSTVRDLDRLRQIVGVLVRHGFGEVVRRTGLGQLSGGAKAGGAPQVSVGQRIRLVLTELGPSFVKLGQIVSTRPDLIPEEIIVELKKLQDDVPPEPFDAVKEVIESDLGAPVTELFQGLSEQPLASASIGQVHKGRWYDAETDQSREVAVKVNGREVFRGKAERRMKTALSWIEQTNDQGRVMETPEVVERESKAAPKKKQKS